MLNVFNAIRVVLNCNNVVWYLEFILNMLFPRANAHSYRSLQLRLVLLYWTGYILLKTSLEIQNSINSCLHICMYISFSVCVLLISEAG